MRNTKLIRTEAAPTGRVRVTNKHIREACRRDAMNCMVYQAILDAFPGIVHLRVDVGDIRFSDPIKRRRYRYFVEPQVRARILDYDRGINLKPFSFNLQDGQVREMGWRAQRSKTATRKGAKYNKTGRKRFVAPRTRQWGMCFYAPQEAAHA